MKLKTRCKAAHGGKHTDRVPVASVGRMVAHLQLIQEGARRAVGMLEAGDQAGALEIMRAIAAPTRAP